MKAKIVQLVDKNWIVSIVDLDDLVAAMEVRGGKFKGTSKSYAAVLAANPGAAVPRPMLWGQPEFDGFAGPMYDKDDAGADCLRYEDWPAYELMSA